MAVLTIQNIAVTGLEPVLVAASALGDLFLNDGRSFLLVDNVDASDKTVTINSVTPCDQGFDHDIAVVVTAGEQRYIGPFNTKRFNNTVGQVEVTYSAVTSVTVAAIHL